MRTGGIAMRCGYSLNLPDLSIVDNKEQVPVLHGFERDAVNLAADWQLVGDDIRLAMQKIGEQIERRQTK